MNADQAEKELNRIPKNIVAMGLVSMFNDIASEMIYPLIPIFLTSVLGAPMTIIGLIEGICEATANIFNVFSGSISDRLGIRKPIVVFGYSLSAVSKMLMSVAYSWPIVLLARFSDRLGKGSRTAARDALITDYAHENRRGQSFGFHRSLDALGAFIGPLTALLLLGWYSENLRFIFYLSCIPSALGVFILVMFVKDKNNTIPSAPLPKISLKELDQSFKYFLITSIIFALGNSADVFLIMRAQSLGFGLPQTLMTYMLFSITHALVSMPAGIVADRIGCKKVLLCGFLLFALVYGMFGTIEQSWIMWILFPLYGLFKAFTEGISRAYIASMVNSSHIASAFGVYQMTIGICAFFASCIAGLMWTYISPTAPFIFGSFFALLAALFFILSTKKPV